jgi:recombination protein RecT
MAKEQTITGPDRNQPTQRKQNQIANFNSFRKDLSKFEKSVSRLLSKNNVDMDKFMVTVENAIRKTPNLLYCERSSLFASILTAAEFGLEPNTPAGLSWIIPYRDGQRGAVIATWQIGYQGVVDLLYRNPRVKKVVSELVYTGDLFDRWMDSSMDWQFKFKPAPDGQRGERKGVFAIIHLRDTEPIYVYLSMSELDEIKAKSKNPSMYEQANDPQGWMLKKAAVKQAAKLAPKGGGHVQNALNIDSMIEGGASIILDEAGKVILQKVPEKQISRDKVNMIFGEVEDTNYEEQ